MLRAHGQSTRGRRTPKAALLRVLVLLQLLAGGLAQAQEFPGQSRWNFLHEYEGLRFSYLYYREAAGENAGVVVMLENVTQHALAYDFKVVFKSVDEDEAIVRVVGSIDAGARKTGSHDGLFWVPWEDKRAIAQVGLRGFKVAPKKQREPEPKQAAGT